MSQDTVQLPANETKPAKSEPAKPEPTKTKPAEPEPTKPEPAKPESAKAEPAKPEPAKTKPAKPEPTKTTPVKPPQMTLEELISSMKGLHDDIGQIAELSSEEKRVVDVFFDSFLTLMKPLAKTMSVSPTALPDEMGNVKQANIDPKGNLMLLYRDGQVEIRNLNEKNQRDLMICVMKDVMPKFKRLTSAHRRKIEERMNFLSSVTKEIQKISKAFSTESTE
jgi:energy-converting hydrogenase A subunit M